MILFIDGDAFPNLLKPIIHRAIEKYSLKTYIIANKKIFIGASEHIESIIVSSDPDEADNKIVELAGNGDLVITSDIPLADKVIEKGSVVINHHGKFFDEDNIKPALAIRNFMQEMRDGGEVTKGQSAFGQKDVREFANRLNNYLNRLLK